MAAPATQTRGTPAGKTLKRGFGACRFTFGIKTTFCIREFEITPLAVVGGPPIRISTFFNTFWHTKVPQGLVDCEAFRVRGQYDEDIFKGTSAAPADSLLSILNQNQACTAKFPHGGQLSVFGWPRMFRFTPLQVESNEPPVVEIDVEVSNYDPVNLVEAGWAYSDGYSGTSDG